ncbi:hypothetical protein VTH06DRAFT_1011 [Thermothelomyces fergusii]
MFAYGLATGALAVLAGSQLAAAHAMVEFPAPFRSKYNPNVDPGMIDYSYTSPLDPSGANYPCKGYHADLGTPAGKPTATFAPGGEYQFRMAAGGARHGGGSCQVSLSYDKGNSFTVIKSIIGGCPLADSYSFTIPADAPEGEAIWAWTWSNEIGNREHYMNCAPVVISRDGGSNSKKRELAVRADVSFSSRPTVFAANINNGCTTTEGVDVEYPDPGPDVERNGDKIGPPVGNCGSSGSGSGSGSGSESGSGSGSGSESGSGSDYGAGSGSGSDSGADPTPTTTSAVQVPSAPAFETTGAAGGLPGGVFITAGPSPTTLSTKTTAAAQPTTTATDTNSGSDSGSSSGSGSGSGSDGESGSSSESGSGSGSGSGSNSGSESGSGSNNNNSNSGNAAGAQAQGTACSEEGAWNCIGGTQFQRCASGAWTAPQPVSAGTVCKPGRGGRITIAAASDRVRVRRVRRGAAKVRLA